MRRRSDRSVVSRRELIASVPAALVSALMAPIAGAQQRRIPVIGWLSPDPGEYLLPAFRQSLRALGYIEGRSIQIEMRSADGDADLLAELADELVSRNVDVLVTNGRAAARAAQAATQTIPIVMAPVGNPWEFVVNLARPGGNITGVSLQQLATDTKQIGLLKEMVPSLSRLAIVHRPYSRGPETLVPAAQTLNIDAFPVELRGPDDIERAFGEIAAKKANGLLVVHTATFNAIRPLIAAAALQHRLPAAASLRPYAEAGLLMSYAVEALQLMRRATAYVDLILKGAKPADLPVEQADKFELVINLKTAKALGLIVQPSLLMRADEVIE